MSTEKQRSSAAINLSQMLAFEARLSRLHRLFKGHFNVTEPSLILEPYLFLGNCISAHDVNRLSKLGIRYILNVAIRDVEVCPYYASDVHTLTIDLRDDDRENIIRTFDQAFAFIDEAKRCRSRVLVHCSHGQSRSPAIVIGYLMRTYNVSLEQCLTHVVKARPCVLPNDGFLKQLIIYDRLLVERRVQQQKQQQQLQQHQQQQQQQQQQRQLQIEASITASTALPPASTALPPAEIPIHHFLPGPSQPLQPPAPVIIAPPPYPDNPTSTATTVSSVDSSSLGLSSTSSLQSSASDNSVHVIPIQIPSEEPLPAKIDPIPIHKIPVEDVPAVVKKSKKNTVQLIAKSKTSKYLTEQSKSYHESSPSIHIKKHGYSIMTTDMKQPPYYSSRSQSATRDRARAQQQYHPPISSSQQWNALSYFPTHYYASDGHQRTRYITEIYDKATNRFIPTCCF